MPDSEKNAAARLEAAAKARDLRLSKKALDLAVSLLDLYPQARDSRPGTNSERLDAARAFLEPELQILINRYEATFGISVSDASRAWTALVLEEVPPWDVEGK